MKRDDFIKSFLLLLSSPFFIFKNQNIVKGQPKSTTWEITDDCTNCGICYGDYEEDFDEDGNGSSAIFKEGHWFNWVSEKGKLANCGTGYYDKVNEVAESCGANAIIKVG